MDFREPSISVASLYVFFYLQWSKCLWGCCFNVVNILFVPLWLCVIIIITVIIIFIIIIIIIIILIIIIIILLHNTNNYYNYNYYNYNYFYFILFYIIIIIIKLIPVFEHNRYWTVHIDYGLSAVIFIF